MGDVDRCRAHARGRGAGDLHGDSRFRAGLSGVLGEATAGIRGRLTDTTYLHWPFFADTHRSLQSSLDAWCVTTLGERHHRNADERCRTRVLQLSTDGR